MFFFLFYVRALQPRLKIKQQLNVRITLSWKTAARLAAVEKNCDNPIENPLFCVTLNAKNRKTFLCYGSEHCFLSCYVIKGRDVSWKLFARYTVRRAAINFLNMAKRVSIFPRKLADLITERGYLRLIIFIATHKFYCKNLFYVIYS